MKIQANSLINGMSGKLSKLDDVVFYRRFGSIYAWRNKGFHGPYSTEQQDVHDRFRTAVLLTQTDLADPAKKAEWESVFLSSKSKYHTLRGMVIAHYIKNGGTADKE